MQEEKMFIEIEGQKIAAIMTEPDKKTSTCIILLHGFTGDKDGEGNRRYPLLAQRLAEKGFAVLRFDCRGSGESDGRFEDMTLSSETSDLLKTIEYCRKKYKKIGVVGSSLGGCITLLAYKNNMDYMVLWYPLIFPKESKLVKFMKTNENVLERNGKILYKEKNGKKFYVGKNLWEEWKISEPSENLKNIKCPVLIVTGNKDFSVDVSQSERAMKLLRSEKELIIIDGADHSFRNADGSENNSYKEKAISATVSWFVKHAK